MVRVASATPGGSVEADEPFGVVDRAADQPEPSAGSLAMSSPKGANGSANALRPAMISARP
jgi:hypothetical protein